MFPAQDTPGRRDLSLIGRYRLAAVIAGAAALALSAAVMLGWAAGLAPLKSVVPGEVTMKVNTALMFAIGGVALLALVRGREVRRSPVVRADAALLALLAGATLLQYVLAVDLRIDELLFDDDADAAGTSHPGRPAPNTAVAFLLLAGALLAWNAWGGRLAPLLAGAAVVMSFFAVAGYGTGAQDLYAISSFTSMAVHTAVGVLVLGLGLLAARVAGGGLPLLAASTAGGGMARRLLPVAVFGPILLTSLRFAGVEAGLFGTREGSWLLAVSCVLLFVGVSLAIARRADRIDAERDRLAAEVERMAQRDPLTDLFNRRRFDEELERQIAESRRYRHGVALLLIDLDRFKPVNDAHGHLAGDALLVTVAERLRDGLRSTDLVARIGGDELAVVTRENGESGSAAELAVRAVELVRAASARLPSGVVVGTTASVGAAVACPGAQVVPDLLMHEADRAMYAAKEAGGDRMAVTRIRGVVAVAEAEGPGQSSSYSDSVASSRPPSPHSFTST